MKKGLQLLFILLFFSSLRAETNTEFHFRTMVNLADYIANDYPNAVENGAVINAFEYEEMAEFTARLRSTHKETLKEYSSNSFLELTTKIDALEAGIIGKSSSVEVKNLANHISTALLDEGILDNAPKGYPSIANGKELYTTHCLECHGNFGKGDGVLGVGLDPAPANLKESAHLFPFHVYNTVRLGIEGTAMKPVVLSDEETWDLAFYVMTLTFEDTPLNSELTSCVECTTISLSDIANLTNTDLSEFFDADADQKLKSLRFGLPKIGKDESLELTLTMLQKSKDLYESGKFSEAEQQALDAYFIGFEPVEISLNATHPNKVLVIEQEMMVLRSLLSAEGNLEEVNKQLDLLTYHFDEIRGLEQKEGFWFTFLYTIAILLREGLEALLIIIAILAALNTFEGGRVAKKYVHSGWIAAVLIGFISYLFVGRLLEMGSQSRELLEGIGAIVSVIILLSVGFWLHNKSTAASWNKYIQSSLSKHLSSNNLLAVTLLSFVVVFREAFESVIFISSLTVNKTDQSSLAVLLGAMFSGVAILCIGIALIKYTKKLPIHQVFRISSIIMLVLAVVLAGKGIKELQEAGYVGVKLLNFNFSVDLLGIYPTVQTLIAQFLVLIIAGFLWFMNGRRTKE